MSWVAVGVGGATLIGGAVSGSQSGPAPPGPRRLAESTVRGNDYFSGRQYAVDAENALNYAGLNQLLQGYGLFGSPGGSTPINYRVRNRAGTGWQNVTRNVNTPESEGLLALLGRVQPELSRLRGEGDAEGNALLDLLTRDATSLINRGSNPYEDRELLESIRGGQAARGMGYGNADLYQEAVGLDRSRDTRRIERGQYGQGLLATRRGYQGDPLSEAIRLLGAGSAAQGGVVQRSSLWEPQVGAAQANQYAGQLANFNSQQNNMASLIGGAGRLGMAGYNAYRTPAGYGGGGGALSGINWGAGGFPEM